MLVLLLVLILDLLAIRAEKRAPIFPQLFCSGQRGSGAAVFSITSMSTSTSTISNFGIWV